MRCHTSHLRYVHIVTATREPRGATGSTPPRGSCAQKITHVKEKPPSCWGCPVPARRARAHTHSLQLASRPHCLPCSAARRAALRALAFSSSSASASMRSLKLFFERRPSLTNPTIPSKLFFAPAMMLLNE